jgi:hypothetical protein
LPGGPLATQIPNALADPWRSLHLLVHYGPLRSHELVDSFDPDGLPQVSQVDNEIDAPETGHDIASDASSVGCWPRRRNDPSRKLLWLREAAFSISVTKEALCEPIFDAGRSIAKLLAAPAPANLDRVMFSTNAGIRAAPRGLLHNVKQWRMALRSRLRSIRDWLLQAPCISPQRGRRRR